MDTKIIFRTNNNDFAISLILNMLLSYFNNYSSSAEYRIIINPFLNSLVWLFIFMTQRKKMVKKSLVKLQKANYSKKANKTNYICYRSNDYPTSNSWIITKPSQN